MNVKAPQVVNTITIGSLASLIGLLVSVIGFGVALGAARADLDGVRRDVVELQTYQKQADTDSRALIRLQADVDYIKGDVAYIKKALEESRNQKGM